MTAVLRVNVSVISEDFLHIEQNSDVLVSDAS